MDDRRLITTAVRRLIVVFALLAGAVLLAVGLMMNGTGPAAPGLFLLSLGLVMFGFEVAKGDDDR